MVTQMTSMSRLYFVCRGSLSLFFRYRMQHQKIRPQTMTPSASAATPDHDHSTRMRSACLVTPVGQPKRRCFSASLTEHPDNTRVDVARMSAIQPPRVQDLRRTSNRLSHSFRSFRSLLDTGRSARNGVGDYRRAHGCLGCFPRRGV